jgi:hypothetical protein
MKTLAEDRSHRRRADTIPAQPRQRSAITNGHKLLPDLDHRGPWARRLRDLIGAHVADLGGYDACSQAELALIRAAAQLRLQLEFAEQQWVERYDGVAPQSRLLAYQRVVGTLRRVLKTLGLQRRSRDVTPSLSQYLAAKYPSEDDDAPAAAE